MARRRASTLESFFYLAALLQPWVALLLAIVSFLLLRWVASGEPPAASNLEDLGAVIAMQRILFAAQVGQYVVPAVFVVGALISTVRRIRRGKLVETFTSASSSANASGRGKGGTAAALTWREFEMLAGEIYRRQGYSVEQTAEGADGGVDLVLRRGGERFFVQCKHWPARAVDVKVVRELKGVMAEAEADGGAVVTSGEFTRDAVEFARRAGVDLVDGVGLLRIARGPSALSLPGADPTAASAAETRARTCPRCGSSMVLRSAKRGSKIGQRFWGCKQFPRCRKTLPADI